MFFVFGKFQPNHCQQFIVSGATGCTLYSGRLNLVFLTCLAVHNPTQMIAFIHSFITAHFAKKCKRRDSRQIVFCCILFSKHLTHHDIIQREQRRTTHNHMHLRLERKVPQVRKSSLLRPCLCRRLENQALKARKWFILFICLFIYLVRNIQWARTVWNADSVWRVTTLPHSSTRKYTLVSTNFFKHSFLQKPTSL